MKLSELRSLIQNIPRAGSEDDYRLMQETIARIGLDPNNFYQELEMESRYVDTHRDVSWTNSRVSLHSHTFYEVLYCRSTCDVEYLVGADRYRLQRGDIIVVPPGISHRPLLPEKMKEPYKRYVLWISPEFIHESTKLVADRQIRPSGYTTLLRTAGTPWEFLEDYFRTGIRESENRLPGWEAAVVGNTMMLLIQISRALADSKVKPLLVEKPELLDLVMGYMEANLTRRLTLGDVARQFYVSESTISQLFRKKMDVSFHRCLTQRRLIAAKSLIEKDVPLELVSEQVGFQDYSAFYRAFKQEYGISPRQYRKRQQDMAVE
ncbi:MAG: helix-turn-helix domain-containing protein [Oscillospiraceae bacterium]|nr:helix-turn-helix domain-containing protein [Oscillospiraceae bacterium]